MSKNSIFISHSSKEISYVDSFLLQEKKTKNFSFWAASNEKIGLGNEFQIKITEAIHGSKGAVILISNNLLNSKFVMNYELPLLIEKFNHSEDYFLIPILVERCEWKKNTLLQGLQLINSDSTPLNELKGKQYTVIIDETSRYISDYLEDSKKRKKSQKTKRRKNYFRRLVLSVSLITFLFFLIQNILNNQSPNPPIQTEINVASLSEEERQSLINQLVGEPEDNILSLVPPDNCYGNFQIKDQNASSCENLIYDFTQGWLSETTCEDLTITFLWYEPIYLEFMVLEHFQDNSKFDKYSSIKNYSLTFANFNPAVIYGEMERDQTLQWQDLNIITKSLEFNIESYDAGETTFCGLQGMSFYGRDP